MATEVSVLAELEQMGIEYTPVDSEHVKCLCPFHDDAPTPSCNVNTRSGLFKCHSAECGAHGDLTKFIARTTGSDRRAVGIYLAQKYGIDQVKHIESLVVEELHRAIWGQPHMLRELYDRGVTDEDIRKYRLGWHQKGRISIPVKSESGLYINIRYYLPGAPGAQKMRNTSGRGGMRLYPPDQLDLKKYKKRIVCGGEIKAIVAARLLNPHGIGAVCATGGEGNWAPEFTASFRDVEEAWVCLDVDEAGIKAANLRAAQLDQVCKWVGLVQLPLDKDKYPKGDLNDFVGRESGDLWAVIQATPRWVSPLRVRDPDEEPNQVTFSETVQALNVGKRMRFPAVVAAASMGGTFVVPRTVTVTCPRDQNCCANCAVFPSKDTVFRVEPEAAAILDMVSAPTKQMEAATRRALGIPDKCDVVVLKTSDHYNVEDVRINPSLEITNRDSDRALQSAVCVGCEANLNGTYEFTGRMYPHPKTQQATLVLAKSQATHDALERHIPQNVELLDFFRPPGDTEENQWTLESLSHRLDEVYDDLEANITRIYLRRDIHLFVDLLYHSVLLLKVDQQTTKGWTELLIVGDSSQGKSEVMKNLMAHYRLGEEFECRNATPAGIVGGLAEIGGAWMVQWGIVPTHDKRLVWLEEAKGLSMAVIASMTGMRSSGRAELTKISRRKTQARTRLGWISNCRHERTCSTYNFGVEMIRDLMGAPEDVRRLDAALIVSSEDVNITELDVIRDRPPVVEHRHTSDLCNALVLWAWTRREDQVEITEEANAVISETALAMSNEFSDQIPLIDKGSTRHKLSRLATSLACRTFSTDETRQKVVIRACHAQYVRDLLLRIYRSRTFGYGFFSEAERVTATMTDPHLIKAAMETSACSQEGLKGLLYADTLDITDMMDYFGWDRAGAQQFLSLLVRKCAIKRLNDRKYVKTPNFIEFLKKVELAEMPPHLKKERF